jgi:glycosyltransferase involved in cell wall biosynthesis
MKIAFNIDYCSGLNTGIGRYGSELINSWAQMGMSFEIWMPRYIKKHPPLVHGIENKIVYYPWPRRLTDYIWPARHSSSSGIQWIHSANCDLLPVSRTFRQVCMIHDMGPFLYGHMKAKKDTDLWVGRIKRVVRDADCIVTNSNSTKDDLLSFFPQVRERVFVTPLGIDHFALKKGKKGTGKHILNVGTVEPRKNIDGLLRAFSALNARKEIPPLVIAGMDGFKAGEYRDLAVQLKINHKVLFTGYISDKELIKLYSEAICLVHPAHHEGFGFTIPEAFTWGLPVVASDTGGIGEFFPETAWMVNPESTESIAHGIELALDSGVTQKQRLKRLELSRSLTWRNCAEKTLKALENTNS